GGSGPSVGFRARGDLGGDGQLPGVVRLATVVQHVGQGRRQRLLKLGQSAHGALGQVNDPFGLVAGQMDPVEQDHRGAGGITESCGWPA
ncbi:MAG: hypothetical protein U9Q17_01040, partial [Chloroflexota bacterium]|nr:hypothetical protein [Chloroflexota bacterium]